MKSSLIGLLLFININVCAQKDSVSIDKFSLIYHRNHFSLSFVPNITQKLKIHREFGNVNFHSRNSLGLEWGFNYTWNIRENLGINFGIRRGEIPNDIRFTLDTVEYNVPFEINHSDLDFLVSYLSYPLSLEYREKLNEKLFFSVYGGVNVRVISGLKFNTNLSYSTDTSSSNTEVFSQNIYLNKTNRTFLNYNVGTAFLLPLKNYHLIKIGVLTNINFSDKLNGDYQFKNLGGKESGGTNTVRMNFIGIDIGYIFTGGRKTLKQFYPAY